MTEQEFQTQVWRAYDKITTADGVPGKVLGVSFNTKSVRAYISGSPEWVRCELIETHTSGKGKECDDAVIIEELHNKVLKQNDEISHLHEKIKKIEEEKQHLSEKISKNYLKSLTTAVNSLREGLIDKKGKIEKVEKGLQMIAEIVGKVELEKPNYDMPAGSEV